MAAVVVFHHALGLTPGVQAFATTLRKAGHDVVVPDLFEGRTFADVESGVAHARQVGFGEITEGGVRAASDMPEDQVYIGMSLGVLPAQRLAQTRPGARGAVLLYSCLPAAEFGGWPDGLPAQVHAMEDDPLFADDGDRDAAIALAGANPGVAYFPYPGDGHLFAEPGQPAHDERAAALMTERVLAFLARA
ncbi:dienelactone hydrolase family protein [Pseudonocardia nematodicida]|uniref:Dienelactone hydrolase family protein n=1 Tax=Pseudonocardia nematodicida TaxID=1206997 RepID=A0ABV1KA27_9PSEU